MMSDGAERMFSVRLINTVLAKCDVVTKHISCIYCCGLTTQLQDTGCNFIATVNRLTNILKFIPVIFTEFLGNE